MATRLSSQRDEKPVHLLTVDLEEYFHDPSLEGVVRPEEWSSLPSRVERSVEKLLGLLERHDSTATFFVVGWLAERHPGLVRRVAAAGHEVASHGYHHRRPPDLGRDDFRSELRTSRAAIQQATGTTVVGYRAPGAPLRTLSDWLHEILIEEGYVYDSSLASSFLPWNQDSPEFGILRGSRGALVEIPVPSLSILGVELATLGGASLRHLSGGLFARLLERLQEREHTVAVHLRSWELDSGVPRLSRDWLTRLRRYRNLEDLPGRLEELLAEGEFRSIADRYGLEPDVPPATGPQQVGDDPDVRQTG